MGAFAAAAVAGLVVQKAAKAALARPRPCFVEGGPEQLAPIPDAGSFPSGHTLHATLAAVAVAALVPVLAAVFVPLALVIAWSRVALGVHYPSDVAAGAALGAMLGAMAVAL
jgi:undecaprenyl-diphosphatase